MKKRILSLIIALTMILAMIPMTAVATEDEYVYLSISYDGQYINGQNGKPIVYLPIAIEDIEAIDLTEYGLDHMRYDADGDGDYDTSALQLLIYAHEELYGGDWGDVNFDDIPRSCYFKGGIFGFTENLGAFGRISYTLILPLFAFTTILAWSYYGQKSTEYLFKRRKKAASTVFSVIYVLLIVVGSVVPSEFVWSLDEMFNALMAIPNLIAIIALSGMVVKITKNYFDRQSGMDIEPMLSYSPELNRRFAQEIKEQENK